MEWIIFETGSETDSEMYSFAMGVYWYPSTDISLQKKNKSNNVLFCQAMYEIWIANIWTVWFSSS